MVKQFPILGRYEPLQPPLPFSNTSTRDTTTCPSIEVHVRNHREAPLATTSRPGAQPPHWAAPGYPHAPAPEEELQGSAHTPPPRLFRAAARCLHTAGPLRQQGLAPSAPTGRQLRGPRQEWSAIQGSPQATLSPRSRSTALSSRRTRGSLLQQAGHGPAGAGGAGGGAEGPRLGAWLTQRRPPGLPGKWSWLLPWGTPWCFRLLRKLHSPASPPGGGEGSGRAGEAEASAAPTTPWGCTS